MSPAKKTCTKCGETKELINFPKNKQCSDGHIGSCRECDNKRAARWRKAHPDKVIEAHKNWRKNHPDKAREKRKRWADENPDRVMANRVLWIKNNPDEIKKHQRKAAEKRAPVRNEKRRMATQLKHLGEEGWRDLDSPQN